MMQTNNMQQYNNSQYDNSTVVAQVVVVVTCCPLFSFWGTLPSSSPRALCSLITYSPCRGRATRELVVNRNLVVLYLVEAVLAVAEPTLLSHDGGGHSLTQLVCKIRAEPPSLCSLFTPPMLEARLNLT